MYRAKFDIPLKIKEEIESSLYFDKIKKELKINYLVEELIKCIKSKPIIKIKKCGGWLGENFDNYKGARDLIHIDPRVTISEMPAVIIHELFHSLFPQLVEKDILNLEFWFMRKAKKNQINKIINFLNKNINIDFIDYKKRVVVEDITTR